MNTFDILYIDPPWKFQSNSKSKMGRNAMKEYNTEPISWVKNLPIGDYANKNSMILIWIIDPHVDKLKEVLDSWGFRYKGKFFTWLKLNKNYQKAFRKMMINNLKQNNLWDQIHDINSPEKFYRLLSQNMPDEQYILEMLYSMSTMGLGFLTRKNSESLYYATKGRGVGIPQNIKKNIRELIFAPRPDNKHSAKPHDVYERVERMYPDKTKIEFFARNHRYGWERAICNDIEPTIPTL